MIVLSEKKLLNTSSSNDSDFGKPYWIGILQSKNIIHSKNLNKILFGVFLI